MSVKIVEKQKILLFLNKNTKADIYNELLLFLDKRKSKNTKNKELVEIIVEIAQNRIDKKIYSSTYHKKYLTALHEVLLNIDNINEVITEATVKNIKILLAFSNKLISETDANTIEIIKDIKELLSISTDYDEDKYLIKIHKKEEEIKSLERDILRQTQLKEKYSQQVEELNAELDTIKKELISMQHKLHSSKVSIKEYEMFLAEKEEELNNINKRLADYEIDSITKSFQIKDLTRNNKNLSEAILNFELEEYDRNNKEELLSQAINLIICLLMQGPVKEESIIESLKARDLELSKEEYKECLKRVREKISIFTTSFNGNKNYQILEPCYYRNQKFNLEVDSDCIDILLVSDLHLTNNINIEGTLNKIYEYADNNGISLILDLGDFFGFRDDNNDSYSRYNNGYHLVEKCINMIPKVDGIYHAILGGNHDKDSFKYGYDAIKLFTDNREDFINLGYDSAIMTINGHISYKTSLLLHHLQKKITDPVHKESFNPKDYHTYLANYHSFDAINPKDYYTSLIGGSHMNGIYNTFILAPSFLNDRKYNGAMHLKIFLNANKEIENIIVINLINNYNLIPVSEMSYKR